MIPFSDRLKTLRKKRGLTQEQLAYMLGLKRSLIGAYEEGRAEPSIERLHEFAHFFRCTLSELLGNKDQDNPAKEADLILLVPVKAAAGYATGYADTHEVEELPGIRFPGLSGHNHRAFELAGDSMLPLASGTVVVGRKIERMQDLRMSRTYILVTLSEGIVYKRVYESPNGDHLLRLHSDNPQYAPYDVAKSEISEAWQAIMYMSSVFPEPEH